MKATVNEMEINGIVYVPKDQVKEMASNLDGLPCVMIRTYSAGVHYGYLSKRESTLAGIEVTLLNSRRVWYWDGAASLSQLSTEGTNSPDNCKFPCAVSEIELVAVEIIKMTDKAVKSLNDVKIWEQ